MSQPELNRRLTSSRFGFSLFRKARIAAAHWRDEHFLTDKFRTTRLPNISKIACIWFRVICKKVVPDPFNLGHPSWEFDENFDIKQHILKVEQDKSFTQNDLMVHAGKVLTGVIGSDEAALGNSYR